MHRGRQQRPYGLPRRGHLHGGARPRLVYTVRRLAFLALWLGLTFLIAATLPPLPVMPTLESDRATMGGPSSVRAMPVVADPLGTPSPRGSALPVTVPSPTVVPSGATPGVSVRGTASWYRWHFGQAAAGPALMLALGAHWRGTTVHVCTRTTCVLVALTDWCACPQRVIDLDSRAFAVLAPLTRGLTTVRVFVASSRSGRPAWWPA